MQICETGCLHTPDYGLPAHISWKAHISLCSWII